MDKNESLRHYLEILVQNGVEVFFPIDLVFFKEKPPRKKNLGSRRFYSSGIFLYGYFIRVFEFLSYWLEVEFTSAHISEIQELDLQVSRHEDGFLFHFLAVDSFVSIVLLD